MDIENLLTLKINELSQKQYDAALKAGLINEDEIYLTPDSDNNIGSSTAFAPELPSGEKVDRPGWISIYPKLGIPYHNSIDFTEEGYENAVEKKNVSSEGVVITEDIGTVGGMAAKFTQLRSSSQSKYAKCIRLLDIDGTTPVNLKPSTKYLISYDIKCVSSESDFRVGLYLTNHLNVVAATLPHMYNSYKVSDFNNDYKYSESFEFTSFESEPIRLLLGVYSAQSTDKVSCEIFIDNITITEVSNIQFLQQINANEINTTKVILDGVEGEYITVSLANIEGYYSVKVYDEENNLLSDNLYSTVDEPIGDVGLDYPDPLMKNCIYAKRKTNNSLSAIASVDGTAEGCVKMSAGHTYIVEINILNPSASYFKHCLVKNNLVDYENEYIYSLQNDIYVIKPNSVADQEYNPESTNSQSGKAVAEAIAAIDIGDKVIIDQDYNPESENAQSGKAMAEVISQKSLVQIVIWGDED